MAAIEPLIDHKVTIITSDGRNIVGNLKGHDQTLNVILEDSVERVFSKDEGVEIVSLGLYVVRGDNIAVIGELDEDLDAHIDYDSVTAEPLKPVVH